MLMALNVPEFPKWKYKNIKTNKEKLFNLLDNTAIETSYQYYKSQEIKELNGIQLEIGEYDLKTENEKIILENNEEKYIIERNKGWTFSYFFDRKYEFYFSIEEFVFPTCEIFKKPNETLIYQKIVLLDGEVVFNLIDKRYNYTIYDVITYDASILKDNKFRK
jgi:hypothetical protein